MTRNRQFGLSLIELMVALVFSSFLILGITQIYVDNKRNYLFQQGQSENQENGRYALLLLEKELAKTGYRRRPVDAMELAFPAGTFSVGSASCTFAAGETLKRVDARTLCLRYQPRDASELDCTGAAISNSAGLTVPYTQPAASFVERITVPNSGTNAGALLCNGTELLGPGSIADISFSFGVGPNAVRKVDSYASTPSGPVRSMRYALLLSSQDSLTNGMTNKACSDWTAMTGSSSCAGDKLYQIVSSGLTLRNLMP